MNEGRDLTLVLAKLLEKSEIIRGQFIATNAGEGQEWIVSLTQPGGEAHGHPCCQQQRNALHRLCRPQNPSATAHHDGQWRRRDYLFRLECADPD